jgi:hypothetical protein
VRTCGVRAYMRTVGAPASLAGRSGAEPRPTATLSREIEKRRETFSESVSVRSELVSIPACCRIAERRVLE